MFTKFANVVPLGTLELRDNTITRVAGIERSYYLDGSSKLPIKEMLATAASKYAISDNPNDYIYEAIRANTANVPNDNHDGFWRDELLRFDVRQQQPVYATYRGKPHHVNHRAENPLTARGVILDATYNESAGALDVCPGCSAPTKEKSARDATGIHCARCGATVKDEFVEILLAVDRKKDPIFAEGVRTGLLRFGSMGCSCEATQCNVCQHVASSQVEFCEHIRYGNKGTYWVRDNGKWERIAEPALRKRLAEVGLEMTDDFVAMHSEDQKFEARKSFERCLGVTYDEYSRVDEPADRKAEQYEILNKAAERLPTEDELALESQQMIARARRRQRRTAMKYYIVRVDGKDIYAAESEDDALALAEASGGARMEIGEVEALSAETAREMQPAAWRTAQFAQPDYSELPEGTKERTEQQRAVNRQDALDASIRRVEKLESDLEYKRVPPDKMEQVLEELRELKEEFIPSLEAHAPKTADDVGSPKEPGIEEYVDQKLVPTLGNEEDGYTPEEMGIMPSAEKHAERSWQESYNDWRVQVSPRGNAQIVAADGTPTLVIRAAVSPKNDDDRLAFGREIIEHLKTAGLTATAIKYNALFSPKLAQMADNATTDMEDWQHPDMPISMTQDGGADDMEDAAARAMPAKSLTTDGGDDDHAIREAPAQSLVDDHQPDHEMHETKPPSMIEDGEHADTRQHRPERSLADSLLDGGADDMIGKRVAAKDGSEWLVAAAGASGFTLVNKELEQRSVTASSFVDEYRLCLKHDDAYEKRLQKIYAAKYEKLKEAHARLVAEAQGRAVEEFKRCLRIAATRHALSIEGSPLKEAFGIALCNPRTVGYDASTREPLDYRPISPELAVNLIETAWKTGAAQELERLMTRAAELAKSGAEYLKAAEADLSKMAHRVPPVTAAGMIDDLEREAEALRQRVTAGNMELSSAVGVSSSGDLTSKIRDALGSVTRTGALVSQYRQV
jgi:hypothetical protein